MKKTLLIIDGGGARGLVPARLLDEYVGEVRKRTGNSGYKITDSVDLIAGTSTGGLIAGGLVAKSRFGSPVMSTAQILDLYRNDLPRIFKKNSRVPLSDLWNEKYNADELESVLENLFGGITNRDTVRPFYIPAYDFFKEEPVDFTTNSPTVKMSHLLRATSSAPLYFRPVKFKDETGREGYYIDGGINANNMPIINAIIEADESVEGFDVNNFNIISLGTGRKENARTFERVDRAGLIYWAKNITPLMLASNTVLVEKQSEKLFGGKGLFKGINYTRINPILKQASPAIDDVSRKQLDALEQDALNDYAENSDHEKIIKILIDGIN